MADAENWKFLLSVYAEHPNTALHLAEQLAVLEDFLKQGQKGKERALAELDQAIEILFERL